VRHIRDNPSIGDSGYMALKRSIREAVRAEVERCIRLWGSGGRTAEVLEQCRAPVEAQA
jgi:fructose-bisphosphate aldolase class II